jgi:peptidoglycan/LPS O-acetylase OafA/YrhL
MSGRPISLLYAAGLLFLIGASGMAAGGGLLGSLANGSTAVAPGVRSAALAIGTTMAVYGFVAVLAGAGLVLLRRWAWRVGIGLIVLGLVALVAAFAGAGGDLIIGFGLALWVLTLACLVVPSTRAALR